MAARLRRSRTGRSSTATSERDSANVVPSNPAAANSSSAAPAPSLAKADSAPRKHSADAMPCTDAGRAASNWRTNTNSSAAIAAADGASDRIAQPVIAAPRPAKDISANAAVASPAGAARANPAEAANASTPNPIGSTSNVTNG